MLKLIDKIKNKARDNDNYPGITIAFLGDSITQGCFEFYFKDDGNVETVFDQEHAYCRYLARILGRLYPSVPFSMINAGISGGTAPHGLARLQRDVLSHNPDLVVVCFGLNDAAGGQDKLSCYTQALTEIFLQIQSTGAEVIFMTPNTANTTVDCRTESAFREISRGNAQRQNSGITDLYMEAAKKLCVDMQIPVCDCYARWKQIELCGVNIAELHSGYMIHPARDTNWLFAITLAETMLGIL